MVTDELKQQIDALSAEAKAMVQLLTRMRDEGRTMAQRPGAKVNWQWVDQAVTNLQNYSASLDKSIALRDPTAIAYAAEQFVSLRKYFEDTSLTWSRLESDVRQGVSQLATQAGKVAFAINPFDAQNVADVRRVLG